MKLKDLIGGIVDSNEITDEVKKSFLELLAKSDLNQNVHFAPGFYLTPDVDDKGMSCHYRNVDASGQTLHGDTGFGVANVIGAYAEYFDSMQKEEENTIEK